MAEDIVDAWMQIPTPALSSAPWLASLNRWTGKDEAATPGRAETLAAMDASGVSLGIISAWTGPTGPLVSNDDVTAHVAAAPDRLRGLISVDLNDPMGAVREIRTRTTDKAIVGVRVLPWLWNLPPNDRRFYPIYAACIDAGVPFCTQIGHTGPLMRSEPGRLIPYLEDVLIDFPELVVVGGHVGFPWIDEVISLAHKFPNFYVDTSAYVLHRLPSDFVSFMKAEGRSRVMFGTNWPMLSPTQCLKGLDGLDLDAETRALFLAGNARRVFKLG